MSKPNNEPDTTASKAKRKSTVSLPPKLTPLEFKKPLERKDSTNDENISKPPKIMKPPLTPTIPEDYTMDKMDKSNAFITIDLDNYSKASRKSSIASRKSPVSSKESKVNCTYDNEGFEGNPQRNPSANSSTRTPSRAPSVQSLEIIHEQYCCCTRRTKCEKGLLITVTVLAIIVIVLVIVIIVLTTNHKIPKLEWKIRY